MRDEEDRARRVLLCERASDRQERGSAGAIVVSAIEDGISPRWTHSTQTVHVDDDRRRSGARIPGRGAVEMLSREQDVVGAKGVVIEAKLADSQVIVVRAHGDVLAFARRIAAGQNGDYVACLDRVGRQVAHAPAEGAVGEGADAQALDRLAEQCLRSCGADLERQRCATYGRRY